jgi:hypothetical protein
LREAPQLSRETPGCDLDAGESDKVAKGLGEVPAILGEAAVAAEPAEGSFKPSAARRRDEAFRIAASLDDLGPRRGDIGDGRIDLTRGAAAVGP